MREGGDWVGEAVQAVNRLLAQETHGDRASLAHRLACSPGPRRDSCIALGPKSPSPIAPTPRGASCTGTGRQRPRGRAARP